ncbi:MAG TPA: glutathione S-transferase N-terminal domain-containing protein [Polyangia bacterium]
MPIFIWLLLAWDKLTGRRPLERSAEAQARVDAETAKLALYHFQACPFCRKVRRDIRLLGLHIEQRDIKQDPARRDELVAGGGKKQVPCLRIAEPDGAVRWLYESRDIGRYLAQRFA